MRAGAEGVQKSSYHHLSQNATRFRLVVTACPREPRAPPALALSTRQRALYFAEHSPLCGRKLRLYLVRMVLQRARILELERRSSCLIGLEHAKPIHRAHFAQNSVNVTLNSFFRET